MLTQHQGQIGEQLASDFLSTQGLELLQRNFHRRIGEIDLLMFESATNTTVLVEVRFRKNLCRGGPLESITAQKRRRLRRTAQLVLQQLRLADAQLRLDVIGISPSHVHDATRGLQLDISGIEYARFRNHNITWVKNAIVDGC